MTESGDTGVLNHAGAIIDRFGGIRIMARRLGLPVSTIQGWKRQNFIPAERREEVQRLALENNIDLSGVADDAAPTDFDAALAGAGPGFQMPKLKNEVSADTLVAQIKAAETRAIQKGALITILLLMTTAAVAAFLLWPAKEELARNGQRVAQLEQQTDALQKAESQTSLAIPQQIKQELKQFEGAFNGAAQQVDDATGIGLAGRVTKLEGQVAALASPAAMKNMLVHVVNFQQSPEGRQMLASAVQALATATGDGKGDADLTQAAQQNDATRQVLSGVSPADLKAAALLLGMTQMRSALGRDNVPFQDDVTLLQNTAGRNDPQLNAALARLAPIAALGVLTPQALAGRFVGGVAGHIVGASAQNNNESLQNAALARLGDVVQVRKDGKLVTGDNTQESVDRAQQALARGDLAGAADAVRTLQGPAAQTAAPWLQQADATLAAQNVATMITTRIAAQMGGTGLDMTTLGAPLTSVPAAVNAVTPAPLVGAPQPASQ